MLLRTEWLSTEPNESRCFAMEVLSLIFAVMNSLHLFVVYVRTEEKKQAAWLGLNCH